MQIIIIIIFCLFTVDPRELREKRFKGYVFNCVSYGNVEKMRLSVWTGLCGKMR